MSPKTQTDLQTPIDLKTQATLKTLTDDLAAGLQRLSFSAPVAYVYNPLLYAREPYDAYLKRFAQRGCEVLLVGMNPGPWGMAQTGVPFGAVEPVRGWLGFDPLPVNKPAKEHPKRPVLGYDCSRNEVSGQRVWSWAQENFGTPERFFTKFFIANYCPLLFLDERGRNLTPDKLKAEERAALMTPCDRALRGIAQCLGVRYAIGIGVWAEKRVLEALGDLGLLTGRVLHPSPASPIANRGWAPQATRQLQELGIKMPSASGATVSGY